MTDQLDNSFQSFVRAVEARLEQGANEYGDRSFQRPPGELVGEIEQELLDVCGWSFVLFQRLQSMRSVLPDEARARAWLRARLAYGGVELAQLRVEAEALGLDWRQLEGTAKALGIDVRHDGPSWTWSLTTRPEPAAVSKYCGVHVFGHLTESESWRNRDRVDWEHHHGRKFQEVVP